MAPSLLHVCLLQLVPRSATFDECKGGRLAAAALSGLGELGARQPWQLSPCCLLVAMDSSILFQASVLDHGRKLVNHWLWKGFKKSLWSSQFYFTAA